MRLPLTSTSAVTRAALLSTSLGMAMTVCAPGASVTWNVTNGNWDTTTANWLPGAPGTYANGDDATFNQAAGGTVTQVGTIAPASTTVSAPGGTYTFQGTGITAGTLTKSGAGNLVLNNANTFSAATVSDGTLTLANPVVALPSIADLKVHLDATQIVAANGSNVTTWSNLAVGGAGDFNVTAGTAPTFVSAGSLMNGRPVVHFNNGGLLTNATNFGNNVTVFYVGRMSGGQNRRLVSSVGNNWLLGYWSGNMNTQHWSNTPSQLSGALDYGAHLFVGTANGTTAWGYNADGNESQIGTGALGQGPNGLALGGWGSGAGSEQSYGDVGELLVYTRALTTEERLQVENYLRAKWFGALPSKSALNLTAPGAIFDVAGVKQTIGSLAGVAGSQVRVNGGDLTIGNDNTTTTYSGTIANGTTAGGTLAKTGNGDLVLAGDATNTFTGTTILQSGRIGLGKMGGAYALSGPLNFLNAASPDIYTTVNNQFAPGAVMQFSGAVGDHVRFELLGTTQTLAGIDNTGAAGHGVIQHREQVTAAAVGTVSNLVLNGSGTYTYDGYLRGSGGTLGLTKNGSGTQILSGANITYNGGTTLNAGNLTFQGANKGITGGMVLNGGVLNHEGTGFLTVGGVLNVAVNSTVNVTNGAGNNQLFFDGGVSGTGNLILNNTGSSTTGVSFRNAGGSFTGALSVNGGQINAHPGAGAVFSNSNVTLSGAAFNLAGNWATGASDASLKSLTGDATSSVLLGAQALTLGTNNGTGTFPGAISGTGRLVKTGTGTQTLSGAVSYTGTTTVNGGVLNLDYSNVNDTKLADAAILTLGGGEIRLTGGSHAEFVNSVTLNPGLSKVSRAPGSSATLDMGDVTPAVGATINFSGDGIAMVSNPLDNGIIGPWATVGSGSSTRLATTDLNSFVVALTGVVATTVNNFNDPTANYEYSLSGGTDVMTADRSANTVRYSGSGETINLNAFLLSANSVLNVGTGTLTLSDTTGLGTLVANGLNLNGITGGFVVNAPISGSNLTTAGTVALNGANDYTGTTTITGGTLAAGSSSAFGTSGVVMTGDAVLNVNGQPLTLTSLTGSNSNVVTNNGASVDLWLGSSANTTFAGEIKDGTGALSLTKVGSGTQTLSGNNTYTGTTTISAGMLKIGEGGTTGTLGAGDVLNNGYLRFHRAGDYTVANTITGTGTVGFLASGAGNITVTGTVTCNRLNFDRPGTTAMQVTLGGTSPNTINSFTADQDGHGVLVLAKPPGVNALSGTVSVGCGGTIGDGYASQVRMMLANNEQIDDAAIVRMGGSSGGHGGRAWFDLMGNGETIAGLTGGTSQSYVRNMAATPSTLTLAGSGTYVMGAGFTQNGGTAPLNIVKSGTGTQTLGGNGIDHTGATTVNAGRLILLNNDDTWTSGLSIASGAVVEINRDNATVYEHRSAFTLSGSGTLEKTGNGKVELNVDLGSTIAMASGGHIDVKEGTLSLGYGFVSNWTNNKADLTVETGATFDLWDNNNTLSGVVVDALNGSGSIVRTTYAATGNLTIGVDGGSGSFGGSISNAMGSINLVKNGAGTQTLSGPNTYSGTTAVNGGTLLVNGTNSGTGAVTVAAAATLGGTGTIAGAVTVNGAIAPGASIGTLATGAATIGATGSLAVEINSTTATADKLAVTGALNITAGAQLNLTDLGSSPLSPPAKLVIASYSGAWNGVAFAGKPDDSVVAVGVNSYTLNYNDTDGGTNAVTLSAVGGADPFADWASTRYGLTGPNAGKGADPDGDGISNILEFATDSDPTKGSSGPRVYPLMHVIGADKALTYTVAVRKNAVFAASGNSQTATKDNVIYSVEGSNTLGDWTPVQVTEVTGANATAVQTALGSKLTVPALNSDWEWHTFRTDGGTASDPLDFIRLRVTATP